MIGGLFGSGKRRSREYLTDGRLEDIIALIQVLGLDRHTNRGESALAGVLGGGPASAGTSVVVAGRHPEFFRVTENGSAALIARHLAVTSEEPRALMPEYIHDLLGAAIQLHQGQLQRRQVLRVAWAEVALALIPSLINIAVVLLMRG